MRSILLAPLCVLLCALASAEAVQPSVGPSARDVVEFTQIVQPRNQKDEALRDQVSPDGTQAFIVTRKADVSSDKNLYEIQVLNVTPQQLAAQREPVAVTVLSVAVGQDNSFAVPAVQDVQWHGNRTLVFLARLDGESFQVYRLDVPKRELVQLTHETNRIVSYAVSQDFQRVVYAAQIPNPPLIEGAHAVVVGSQSFWGVKFGQHDLVAQDWRYRNFVADVASRRLPRALGEAFAEGGTRPPVSISPDGRWALLPRYEATRLAGWVRQYPLIAKLSKKFAWSQQVDPLHYFSNVANYVPRRMMAWRLDDGMEHTVVDAPDDLHDSSVRMDILWQGPGTSVVLAGTHLPPTADGKTSSSPHIIEYWPDRGQWNDIATLENVFEDAHLLPDGFWVLDGTKRRAFHRQAVGGWRESTEGAEMQARSWAWTLRIVQGLNRPPDVYAAGPAGETRRLTWLNPQFKADTWGEMHPYTWRDAAGRRWDGGLMSGNDMNTHSRYPLLIQTYGFSPDRFYLDGPNPSDGATSGFAGRAFLREGMLVLAMPFSPANAPKPSEHQALQAFNEGVRGAIDALVKEGRVDPSRVGIIGWSATGERVLNLVTFGDVPIRAATLADGDANTVFTLAVSYARGDSIWGRLEEINEGLPFGDNVAEWVRNDPALHTDCIRAALRIETYGPWVLPNWDVYALLRRQYKPAEMIVVPGGTHSLLTPGDRMVSLQGNVDWYGFWLANKKRIVPLLASETPESVAAQTARWQQMETLREADDARPRCVR